MNNSDLWSENDLLRKRLLEVQAELNEEHQERLRLKAENLWLKKVIQDRALLRSPEELAEKLMNRDEEFAPSAVLGSDRAPDRGLARSSYLKAVPDLASRETQSSD